MQCGVAETLCIGANWVSSENVCTIPHRGNGTSPPFDSPQ